MIILKINIAHVLQKAYVIYVEFIERDAISEKSLSFNI